MVEHQFDDINTLQLLTSIATNVKRNAQVIIVIPKLVGKIGDVFNTYLDKWDSKTGHYPVRGKFNLTYFIKEIEIMGYTVLNYEISDVRTGFFNRNSFKRHMQSWKTQDTDFEFFKELIIECVSK